MTNEQSAALVKPDGSKAVANIQQHLQELRLALLEADGVRGTKHIVDAAAFLADAARKAKLSLETVNEVQGIRLDAEIKLGQEIDKVQEAGFAKHGGDRKSSTRTGYLKDYDIDDHLSTRSQFFAAYADEVKELAAKELPELSVLKLYADLRRQHAADALRGRLSSTAATVEGVFDVLVIDPPWPMKRIERDVRPNQPAALEYSTMSEEELLAWVLPQQKAADDCHVFLWTTHKFLPLAFSCLATWEMEYTCCFVWHKAGGFQPLNFPQLNCEFCLYARYGNPRFLDAKDFPVCFEGRRGAHSEKPEEFYEVLRRVTGGRRLDMFNRRAIEGFVGWGKEAEI